MTPAVERLVEAAKLARQLTHCSLHDPSQRDVDCPWPTCRNVTKAISAVEAEERDRERK